MLLAPLLYKVMLYGALALVVFGFALLKIANAPKPAPPVPSATTAPGGTQRGAGKRIAMSLGGLLGAMAAAYAAFTIYRHKTDVVFVEDHDGKLIAYRKVWLGEQGHFTATKDSYQWGYVGRDATWIVNTTTRPLRIEFAAYGQGTPTAPRPIDAGETLAVTQVDYLGPDDSPPSSIKVSQDGESISMRKDAAFRYWLTWD